MNTAHRTLHRVRNVDVAAVGPILVDVAAWHRQTRSERCAVSRRQRSVASSNGQRTSSAQPVCTERASSSCYRCLQSAHSPMCIVMSTSSRCAMRAIWLWTHSAAHPSAGLQLTARHSVMMQLLQGAGCVVGEQRTCQPSPSAAPVLRSTSSPKGGEKRKQRPTRRP